MSFRDQFYDNATYVKTKKHTPQPTQKYVNHDKPYLDALEQAGIKITNVEYTKQLLSKFRNEFGIKYTKKPNSDEKQQWIDYYRHEA